MPILFVNVVAVRVNMLMKLSSLFMLKKILKCNFADIDMLYTVQYSNSPRFLS